MPARSRVARECAPLCATCDTRSAGARADVQSRCACMSFVCAARGRKRGGEGASRAGEARSAAPRNLSRPNFPALMTRTRSRLASRRLPPFVRSRSQGPEVNWMASAPCFSACLSVGLDPVREHRKTPHSVPIHANSRRLEHREP